MMIFYMLFHFKILKKILIYLLIFLNLFQWIISYEVIDIKYKYKSISGPSSKQLEKKETIYQ